ncbi:MAG TPA: ABC transporter permease [Polyangiaceae bacterium]
MTTPDLPSLEETVTERVGGFELVVRELRKNRVAAFGLRAIALLVVLAVSAPLISSNQPFVYRDATGFSSPWLHSLFDRLLYENAVDLFFNLLLVLTGPTAIGVMVAKRRLGPRFRRARGRLLAAFALGLLALFLVVAPKHWGPFENPLAYSRGVVNYREEIAALEARGERPLAVFPLRPFAYRETDVAKSLLAPSAEHWLGTDTEGRDVFARMLYGTRISLTIGVVAVGLYVAIGVVLGALAGYFGGFIDVAVSRLVEIMLCFPTFFLILTLAALIQERSIFHVMLIIGVTSWTGVARLVRAEFLKHKGLEYSQAARALGLPTWRVLFVHILPNAIAPVLVSATFGIAGAILVESSLSFLGIGDLSVPSWGETLNSGRVEGKLWLILAPGFAIFFVVTVFNLVGEGLRDALDPKLRT